MNIETLLSILGISLIAACISRIIGGWTLAGLLSSFLVACLGAVGGWVAQRQLGLPALFSISFPTDGMQVPVVWPSIAALLTAFITGRILRKSRPVPRRSRR